MYQLIPNVTQLEQNLENFASIIDADEVLLFERATFLVSTVFLMFKPMKIKHKSGPLPIIKKELDCQQCLSFKTMGGYLKNFANSGQFRIENSCSKWNF